MIIKKITTGFVIQDYDTALQRFLSQAFVAGDECVYEDEKGEAVDPSPLKNGEGAEAYLPFEMRQPQMDPCDECGEAHPAGSTAMTGPSHKTSCSRHPENIVAAEPPKTSLNASAKRDFELHELDSTYAGAGERFVVSLIVSFSDEDEEDPKSPKEAVAAALALTTDEGSPDTQWYCYDRLLKKMCMIEQGEVQV